jgi:hypothetical protein
MDNIHKAKTIIVNKVLMTREIINRLEELYSNYLVYRTIIVCDDNSLDKYVNILRENNYDCYVLKDYDAAVNYDSLDVRIFLIEKGHFIKFIKGYIDNKISANADTDTETDMHRYGAYFYNSIIIQFDNDNDNDYDIIGETERIKREYKEISNNYDIII